VASGKNRDRVPRPPVVAEEDLRLFREAVKGARPIAAAGRMQPSVAKPAPVPIQSLLDSHAALEESRSGALSPEQSMETGEELVFLRSGLPLNILKQLRRGRWVAQDALDLHGLTQVQARAVLAEFLAECIRRRLRCVRIIHGKGLRSPNREPVLKGKLHQWLAHRDEILAYCQAPQNLGGSGALLVLLKG
jgi:DNA-nicking Smr family endonuclease